MKLTNPKKITVMLLLLSGVIISVAATKPTPSKIQITKVQTTDTGFFKNLQVLPKDISKDSLDRIMHGFTAALGVRCNFCHVFNGKPDFASDDKEEKGIARYMIKMAAGINATYFNFEKSDRPDTITVIKCVTCHHGSAHPGDVESNNGGQDNMQQQQTPPPPPPGDTTNKPSPNQ